MEAVEQAQAHEDKGHHGHQVKVTVDGIEKTVRTGKYTVAELKGVVAVPAELVLDQVIDGSFKELKDTDEIKIKGGEQFVSHSGGGGSA